MFVGGALEGFACTLAHHTDVGGLVPGSNSTNATEIYQEGLRLPTLKLYERGAPSEAIFAILERTCACPTRCSATCGRRSRRLTIGERGLP